MDTQALMLAGLLVNFVAMVIGGVSLFVTVLRHNVRQENRMATMEEQINQLMLHRGMRPRRKVVS